MAEAKKIGLVLLKKRLIACAGFIPKASSMYFWPPKKNKIVKSREVILLVDTLSSRFSKIEREVRRLHSYSVPCILAIPVKRAHRPFVKWLTGELG